MDQKQTEMTRETFNIRGKKFMVEYETLEYREDLDPFDYVEFYETEGDFIDGDQDGTDEILNEIAAEIYNRDGYRHAEETIYRGADQDEPAE